MPVPIYSGINVDGTESKLVLTISEKNEEVRLNFSEGIVTVL